MKKLTGIVLFLIGCIVMAQEDQGLFSQGNSLYNDGNYNEAISHYEAIIEKGKHSSELYFNLGNAYYKMNQVGPSIYYYEKALKLSPKDKDIENNLKFAQNMTIDAIEQIPEIGFSRIDKAVVNTFSFDVWATLAVSLTVIFVILFLSYYFSFSSTLKRFLFLSSFSSLFLVFMALVFAFQKYNYDKNDKGAIVFAQETEVRTDPNLRSESAFNLHEGTKVQVIEHYDDNWTKIKLADGKTGWISSEDIKEL
jgi:tetratricopeptide (TPR) repeat protein